MLRSSSPPSAPIKASPPGFSPRAAAAPPPQTRMRKHFSVYIGVAALFSIVVNLLMLVSPLYMLQVYDRVLTSGSVDTLVSISVLAVALLMVYGVAEMARRKTMVLASKGLPDSYGKALFNVNMQTPQAASHLPQDFAYLSTVQNFFANGLILPVFDLPFTPLFICVMFLIHPMLGWLGLGSVLLLGLLAVITEMRSRNLIEQAQGVERMTQNFTDDMSRQQSAITSLGMTGALYQKWAVQKLFAGHMAQLGAQRVGAYSAMIRSLRIILQVAVLGLGGWLVLQYQTTAGAIIAGSILLGRALAPIDQLVGSWRQYIQTQKAWKHLKSRLAETPQSEEYTPLPRPPAEVKLHGVHIAPPGMEQPLLPKVNTVFPAHNLILLFGPSGSGKTSVLQTISGAWPAFEGRVTLGDRDIHRWNVEDRGRYVGYMPQQVELLPGTVFENIARFTEAEPETVMDAARAAHCHEMILGLPDGYDTQIGHVRSAIGIRLSAGQTQAIGLARALFRSPVLLLLDEPTANLDPSSVQRLKARLQQLKAEDTVILVASHDLRLADVADTVVHFQKGGLNALRASDFINTVRPAPGAQSQENVVSV